MSVKIIDTWYFLEDINLRYNGNFSKNTKVSALPVFKKLYIRKDTQIIVWKIEESEQVLLQALENTKIANIATQFKLESHRKQYLCAQLLLKNEGLLSRVFKNKNGKPLIKGGDIFISLSHDQDMVALMVSNKLCGIDLQTITQKSIRIKNKFVHPDDWCWNDDTKESLSLAWSAKEALYKINGNPMVYFKEHIRLKACQRYKITANILHPDYMSDYEIGFRTFESVFLVYNY